MNQSTLNTRNFPLTELLANPLVRRNDRDLELDLPEYATLEAARNMRALLAECPIYAPTPLHSLPVLAAALGIAEVHYKDEGQRLGLKSFKALGGTYAVGRVVQQILKDMIGREVTLAELTGAGRPAECDDICVTSATDGNHGRAVAAGARLFGVRCVIFLPKGASRGREAAISALGAKIIRIDGNYDETVRATDAAAKESGWHVISDTSYDGYEDIPKEVMRGYGVIIAELFDQMEMGDLTHIFLQGGVGAFAAVMSGVIAGQAGMKRPHIIVVEPDKAACLTETARAGQPVIVKGDHETMMACLACGEVSGLGWHILAQTADHFMTIPDLGVAPVMRMLATGELSDGSEVRIEAGESAVAGLLGLMASGLDDQARAELGLGGGSRVLIIGTEGATDTEIYGKIIAGIQ